MFFGGDPFAGFAQQGGRESSRGSAAEDVDTTKLYETLGVAKHADAAAIKKAYRKLAVIHHPDKGGDEHKFKEINAAYEILSDPDKRKKYDQYGLNAVSDDGQGHFHGEDLFSMFFGRSRRSRGTRRGEDVNHVLNVTLEDLYNGKTMKMAVNRQVLDGESRLCTICDGKGHVVELRQIALGMIQQLQRRCHDCAGEGYLCKTKQERKILEIHIEKGMKHKERIVVTGMADERPNMEPGNINFIIQEADHKLFSRKGADLLLRKTLSLNEALCGFVWKFIHLDKREMVIKSNPGEVIRALTENGRPFVKAVQGEGMPSKGNPFVRGDLYVLFTVEFPKDNELSNAAVDALRVTLPNPAMQVEYDENTAEIHHLEQADVKNFGKGGATTGDSTYDEDDEGPQPVQCQQT